MKSVFTAMLISVDLPSSWPSPYEGEGTDVHPLSIRERVGVRVDLDIQKFTAERRATSLR
jgi:hypothetical protein